MTIHTIRMVRRPILITRRTNESFGTSRDLANIIDLGRAFTTSPSPPPVRSPSAVHVSGGWHLVLRCPHACETREEVTQRRYLSFISRGARTCVVKGLSLSFVISETRVYPNNIHEDVPAQDYAGEYHAALGGEHLSRHGNLDQQTRQTFKHCILVDLHGGLLLPDEAVEGLLGWLLDA